MSTDFIDRWKKERDWGSPGQPGSSDWGGSQGSGHLPPPSGGDRHAPPSDLFSRSKGTWDRTKDIMGDLRSDPRHSNMGSYLDMAILDINDSLARATSVMEQKEYEEYKPTGPDPDYHIGSEYHEDNISSQSGPTGPHYEDIMVGQPKRDTDIPQQNIRDTYLPQGLTGPERSEIGGVGKFDTQFKPTTSQETLFAGLPQGSDDPRWALGNLLTDPKSNTMVQKIMEQFGDRLNVDQNEFMQALGSVGSPTGLSGLTDLIPEDTKQNLITGGTEALLGNEGVQNLLEDNARSTFGTWGGQGTRLGDRTADVGRLGSRGAEKKREVMPESLKKGQTDIMGNLANMVADSGMVDKVIDQAFGYIGSDLDGFVNNVVNDLVSSMPAGELVNALNLGTIDSIIDDAIVSGIADTATSTVMSGKDELVLNPQKTAIIDVEQEGDKVSANLMETTDYEQHVHQQNMQQAGGSENREPITLDNIKEWNNIISNNPAWGEDNEFPLNPKSGSNCTHYAWGMMLYQGAPKELKPEGNANQWLSWAEKNIHKDYISKEPIVGSIIHWPEGVGWRGSAGDYGHVAILEDYDDDYLYVSDSGWTARKWGSTGFNEDLDRFDGQKVYLRKIPRNIDQTKAATFIDMLGYLRGRR